MSQNTQEVDSEEASEDDSKSLLTRRDALTGAVSILGVSSLDALTSSGNAASNGSFDAGGGEMADPAAEHRTKLYTGTLDERPAPGVTDRYWAATDAKVLYRDTGDAWVVEGGLGSEDEPLPEQHVESLSAEEQRATHQGSTHTSPRQQAPRRSGGPLLVMEYDDGKKETYDEMLSVHENEGVPCSINVSPSLLGTPSFLTQGELVEFVNTVGAEVQGHQQTKHHLGKPPLTEDATAGDTKIYVATNLHGDADDEYATILIEDDNNSETATPIGRGSDATGEYIELESGLSNSYSTADNATERLTDQKMAKVLGGVLDTRGFEDLDHRGLLQQGFHVSTFVWPGALNCEEARRIASQYYEAVGIGGDATTQPQATYNSTPYDPMRMNRRNMETDGLTDSEIQTFLNQLEGDNRLGILGGHPQYDTMTADRAQFVIDEAKARDIPIVTLQEAVRRFQPRNYTQRIDFPNGTQIAERDDLGNIDLLMARTLYFKDENGNQLARFEGDNNNTRLDAGADVWVPQFIDAETNTEHFTGVRSSRPSPNKTKAIYHDDGTGSNSAGTYITTDGGSTWTAI